jgi:hypothetical protein
MSRNGPVIHTTIIELLAPWGPETLHFPSDRTWSVTLRTRMRLPQRILGFRKPITSNG